ncbi:MAG: cbb3-type cytochrome c oxidase subunit 3 [Bacteroidetes bacterium]|nr:cbb3-type cytochrome c oxidase subunit 3 [Bacteroidota bacterium]
MRFVNSLKSIDGVSIYPIITLILFMVIFVLAVILIFSKSKETINEIKNLPLDGNENESQNLNNNKN